MTNVFGEEIVQRSIAPRSEIYNYFFAVATKPPFTCRLHIVPRLVAGIWNIYFNRARL
jgi:hypothetical protein